jgi:hypothetical protein
VSFTLCHGLPTHGHKIDAGETVADNAACLIMSDFQHAQADILRLLGLSAGFIQA